MQIPFNNQSRWLSILTLALLLPSCGGPVMVTAPLVASQPVFVSLSAPDAVDLRSQMTPPRNQGERNTCNAFAATSLMEFLIRAQTGKSLALSEAYNYWVGKHATLNTNYLRETYRHIDGLAGFLAVQAYQSGSMLESEWPYEATNWQQNKDPRCKMSNGQPDTDCFTGTPPTKAKTLPFKLQPIFVERNQMASFILKEKKPVIFNIQWVNEAANPKTGQLRMPTEKELKNAGGHVITLVGYEPKDKRFIFRNSYGEGWGNKGYGTIPEAYITNHCEVCPYLPTANTYAPEVRDFIQKSSMGVSGSLL